VTRVNRCVKLSAKKAFSLLVYSTHVDSCIFHKELNSVPDAESASLWCPILATPDRGLYVPEGEAGDVRDAYDHRVQNLPFKLQVIADVRGRSRPLCGSASPKIRDKPPVGSVSMA
jgi:hypothetical protein